jgi:1-acyl-sn-glycerol-3-phosphate acyltransferase
MKWFGWKLLNFLQACFLCAWSVIWISAALVVSIFSSELPLVMARHIWGPGLIRASLIKLQQVPGARLGPGPYIFVMNHQSMIDIPIAFACIPVNLRFVAKKILKSVPFLGWYMWRTRMVFVDRGNRTQAMASLKRAGRQIREGASILAYPEGTRTVHGEVLPFKKGVFVVALEAGVPIVPVAIDGSNLALPRDGFRLRPLPVKIKLGDPIPTEGLTHEELPDLMHRVRGALIDLHVSIGGKGGDKDHAIALPGREGIGRRAA